MFLIGADPELFLHNGQKYISAIDKIGGTKYEPRHLLGGFALQEDNVAVEYNIPACNSADRFAWANEMMLEEITKIAGQYSCKPAIVSSANFDDAELEAPAAKIFGCDPDFNAWSLEPNPRPQCDDPSLRSAGGHIHIGMESATSKDKVELIRVCDLVLGVPLALMDPESKRRALYGRAGACRMKSYGVEYRTPSNVWLRDPELMIAVANIVIGLDGTYKQLVKYVNEKQEAIEAAINDLNMEAVSEVLYRAYDFWSPSIIDKFVQIETPESEAITLVVEE